MILVQKYWAAYWGYFSDSQFLLFVAGDLAWVKVVGSAMAESLDLALAGGSVEQPIETADW